MLVSFVGKTCTFLRLFPALNRRLKNASPASCDALRITFSVTLFCAPNERLDPKMDHRLLVIKNPPRFFFAQPPSRTRRSQLSRAHTHFHTPQTFENTNQFPVWPTVSPYLSQYPPDSRQQLSSVLSHLTLFSFSAYAPHVFSTRLLGVVSEFGSQSTLSGSRGRNPPVEGGHRHAKVLCHISRRYATGQ